MLCAVIVRTCSNHFSTLTSPSPPPTPSSPPLAPLPPPPSPPLLCRYVQQPTSEALTNAPREQQVLSYEGGGGREQEVLSYKGRGAVSKRKMTKCKVHTKRNKKCWKERRNVGTKASGVGISELRCLCKKC